MRAAIMSLDTLAGADSRIEATGDDVGQRRVDGDLQIDCGVLREKAREQRREHEVRRWRQYRKAQEPGGLVAEYVDRLEDGVEVVEQRAQPRQQPLASRRRRYAARRPVEEAHAEAVFEPADGLAQSRAGDAQLDRGLGKAAPLRNGYEGVHLPQFWSSHSSSFPNNPSE